MKRACCLRTILVWLVFLGGLEASLTAQAQNLDTIGVTLLRMVTTNVNGTGIRVAQPEASDSTNTSAGFEVNPANSSVQQPVGLFTYIATNGTANDFPNTLGSESGHADSVAGNFYGMPGGVATNVAHVDNYDANYLHQQVSSMAISTNYTASLPACEHQRLRGEPEFHVFGNAFRSTNKQAIDSAYDNYAAQYNTLFVSGAGNGGPVRMPAGDVLQRHRRGRFRRSAVPASGRRWTMAAPSRTSSRPAGVTSFSTPQVAGAAAVLMQAGLRGDGGSDTNSAADIRTVKALLLNGAVKPADWTNNPPSPLDTRYGAGVLNVFNSYEQLAGGKHGYIVSTSVSTGSPHPPTGATGTISALSGWDFNTNTSSSHFRRGESLLFQRHQRREQRRLHRHGDAGLEPPTESNQHQQSRSVFVQRRHSNLVACSTSLVDNVEHIFVPQLAPGRYDLQVLEGRRVPDIVSSSETYALAWEFFSTLLNARTVRHQCGILTWPIYPDGFVLESATNLTPPIAWNTNQSGTNGDEQSKPGYVGCRQRQSILPAAKTVKSCARRNRSILSFYFLLKSLRKPRALGFLSEERMVLC